MVIKICERGHYYDTELYKDCPYCKRNDCGIDVTSMSRFKEGGSVDNHEEVTMPMWKRGNGGQPSDMFYTGMTPDEPDEEKTHAYSAKNVGDSWVVGWLVGVDGPVKGRDFRLKKGYNWIGRAKSMDISIPEGLKIADFNHCSVVYDHKGNLFFVLCGEKELTYLNDCPLDKVMQLKMGDVIRTGNCRFEFIPFCREGHKWEE